MRRDIENKASQLPPFDTELEQKILYIICSYKHCADYVSKLSEEYFYGETNRIVFSAIKKLFNEDKPIDIITLTSQLRQDKKRNRVGGVYELSKIVTGEYANSGNIEYFIKLLQELYFKRAIIENCSNSIDDVFNDTKDVFDVYENHQQSLERIILDVTKTERIKKVSQINQETLMEAMRINDSGGISGVPIGISNLQKLTNGWQKNDLIILAGRPSMGKTAFALSLIIEPCVEKKEPIGFFSLEMSSEQLVGRLQSALSEIAVDRIIKKQLSVDDINFISNKTKCLEDAPLYIDDTPSLSILDLKVRARNMVRQYGVKMIIIDYLQLMTSSQKNFNREQEIAEISKGLKGLAKELKIPVIALAQLSRSVEQRADRKPMLSDLRDSGQIEQDADMVLFAYRPEYYGFDKYEVDNTTFDVQGLFMCIVAKNRNGSVGELPMTFIGKFTRVTNHNPNFSYENTVSSSQEPSSNFDISKYKDTVSFDNANVDDLPF